MYSTYDWVGWTLIRIVVGDTDVAVVVYSILIDALVVSIPMVVAKLRLTPVSWRTCEMEDVTVRFMCGYVQFTLP